MKGIIVLSTKVDGELRRMNNIEVDMSKEKIGQLMQDLGEQLESLNEDADLTVSFLVYNSISGTYMEMMSFYPQDATLITH